ncbi:MAG: SMP-30/gluconolactonase/LRE family protein [Chromatiales bacterium]|jgi:sugar lactone lactonase YvrE
MRKLLLFMVLIGAAIAALALLPGRVDPAAWQPPAAPPLSGAFAPNDSLKDADLVALGQVYGPEDIAVDNDGRIYGGTQDGKVIRVLADGTVETFAETGGRPLGLHFDGAGNLIVADAYRGLLSLSPGGEIAVLTTGADGIPFGFTDDLDIASDGTIYFSDASSKFEQSEYMLDLLEMRPHGRLLAYYPTTGETRVLLDGLYFANGVALSQDESFVLVNETWAYRIRRLWLSGEKEGSADIFVDNLPGFPDGISANRNGRFWLALPTTRLQTIDKMHPHPWAKRLSSRLPEWLKPKPVEYGFVAELDEQGNVLASYHDRDGTHLQEITSVEEHNGYIYLGTLHGDRIGRLKLPAR